MPREAVRRRSGARGRDPTSDDRGCLRAGPRPSPPGRRARLVPAAPSAGAAGTASSCPGRCREGRIVSRHGHRIPRSRRAGRLRAGAPPPRAVLDRLAPAQRARRRVGHAALRGGGRRRSAAAASATWACRRIPLDSIVGTVDRSPRRVRPRVPPRLAGVRGRWESIAAARGRGEEMPPIDVYRVGELHFVEDGHHRVSVARALGDTDIEAHVREVQTKLGADRALPAARPPAQAPRAGLPRARPAAAAAARARIHLSDEWRWAQLASLIEAWGFRASQDARAACCPGARWPRRGSPRTTSRWSRTWTRRALGGAGTETERYLRVAILRYLLLHTNEWTDDIVERLRAGAASATQVRGRHDGAPDPRGDGLAGGRFGSGPESHFRLAGRSYDAYGGYRRTPRSSPPAPSLPPRHEG